MLARNSVGASGAQAHLAPLGPPARPPSRRLFQQPLVPMVSGADGRWLLTGPLQPLMKPGGHGVIWKLMLDSGVFGWLGAQGRSAAIVRQIRWAGGRWASSTGVWERPTCALHEGRETARRPDWDFG